MPPTPIPNGSAEAPIETNSLLPIVGINFGNAYASIAVFTKEGVAECIANEDGERQIACAVSFLGEEIYIGNQAIHQLVKNSENTIIGFRNLLGKKFSEIPQSGSRKSALVIQHPDIPDEPAYKVQVLQPAPSPLPQSNYASTFTTPAASHAPTPRSEPIPVDRFLSVSEVTTLFLASLFDSATAFLGKSVVGAVLSVPTSFSEVQKDALEKAATAAGIRVLQLLDEAGAAAATTTSALWAAELPPDRTQLVVDLGYSSLSLTLLSIRSGLAFVLASNHITTIGAHQIDEKLIKFFATDFTKKTKTALNICPSSQNDRASQRAEAKLLLAIEHTKRTISASPGVATCSVESLKDGLDYTGSINRMRFDLVVRPVYAAVASAVSDLLSTAQVDPHLVDEIVYVGGSASLPGLDETLCASGFREDVQTPFARGTVVGGGVGDPTTILARGCAAQAALLCGILDNEKHKELRKAYQRGSKSGQVQATSRTIGVLLPGSLAEDDKNRLGGSWAPVVHKETALPARRVVRFDVQLSEEGGKVALEVWEVSEAVRVEKVVQPPLVSEDDEEPEEPEEVEVKHIETKKETFLGAILVDAKLGLKIKGKGLDKGKVLTTMEVQFIVEVNGGLKVDVKEVGEGGATGSLRVPALTP